MMKKQWRLNSKNLVALKLLKVPLEKVDQAGMGEMHTIPMKKDKEVVVVKVFNVHISKKWREQYSQVEREKREREKREREEREERDLNHSQKEKESNKTQKEKESNKTKKQSGYQVPTTTKK